MSDATRKDQTWRTICAIAVAASAAAALALLLAYLLYRVHLGDMQSMPTVMAAGTPTAVANQYAQAWHPFTAHEDGATLRCVASANIETLEPMAQAVEPTPTPGAAPYTTYYNYSGYGGAYGYSP